MHNLNRRLQDKQGNVIESFKLYAFHIIKSERLSELILRNINVWSNPEYICNNPIFAFIFILIILCVFIYVGVHFHVFVPLRGN